MTVNLNYIQALEKAIKEKYGEIATMNPKHFWDEDKEKQYIEETKKVLKKEYASQDSKERVEIEGIMVSKNVLNNKEDRTCKLCKKYSFDKRDDIYIKKFNACYKCYLCKLEDK
jgi:hypothetical protein